MVAPLPFDPLGGAIGAAERQRRAAAFDPTRAWVSGDSYNLSDRVWLARQSVRQAIDRTLVSAIATGEDPLVTARKLEQWLSPSWAPRRDERGRLVARQPKRLVTQAPGRAGAGSFAARRLARTELSRANAQAALSANEHNPFSLGSKWNLSPSHGHGSRGADECDGKAHRDSGMGPGVYRHGQFPAIPSHAMCLCYVTSVPTGDTRAVVQSIRSAFGLGQSPERGPLPVQPSRLRSLIGQLYEVWRFLRGEEAA